ncbi:MAG: hypothetical protein H5U13_08855 [Parvibaculum sp.]|nr:hypothetical protein [Parvibaculum sp.]
MDQRHESIDWQAALTQAGDCPRHVILDDGPSNGQDEAFLAFLRNEIGTFLGDHLALADQCVDHPCAEIRAIAADYVNIFKLSALLEDPDPIVRMVASRRLPDAWMCRSRGNVPLDTASSADRVQIRRLLAMLMNEDIEIRRAVVSCLPQEILPLAAHDGDAVIRHEVVRRIAPDYLANMIDDFDPSVRLEVVGRLPATQLPLMARDGDSRVRFAVAERISESELAPFLDDPESAIRELAGSRLAASSLRHVRRLMGEIAQPATLPSSLPLELV